MSNRNGRYVAALGGLTLLAVFAIIAEAWVYASPGPPPVTAQQRPEAHAQDAEADAIGCDPERPVALPPSKRAAQAHACAQYAEQRQLSEDSIAQATRSANAAERQLDLTYRQVRGALIQAVATVAALLAAVGAAVAATWAAIYTRRQALAAEEALFNLERPIVIGFVPKPEAIMSVGGLPRPDTANINISNFGRSPAFLRRIEYDVAVIDKGGIIDVIDPGAVGGRELPEGTVSIGGDPYVEPQSIRFQFSMDDNEAIENARKSVWVTGFVRFDDIFGKHHISGFTWVYYPFTNRYIRRGGQTYNYSRTEKAEEIPEPSSDS